MDEVLALYEELHNSLGKNEICKDFCDKITQIIQDAVDSIPSGARIGLRCADRCMKQLIAKVDFTKSNIVGVYDLMRCSGEFEGYPLLPADDLTCASCEYVIFATYTYRSSILRELSAYEGRVMDIYSLLAEHGIELRGPFNHYQFGMPLVLNYFYLKFIEAENQASKQRELKNFLQAAVEYKDFALIDEVYRKNGGSRGIYPVLIQTWEKVQRLLDVIQSKVQRRKQKDILAYWTDAISWFDLENMPGIQEKANQGCFFERTYTNAPWTRPVLQTIFQKLLPIDGFPATQDTIGFDNSSLLQYLESSGYEFLWVSFPVWAMDSNYQVSGVEKYMSNSLIWWYGLQALLESQKPCFCIFHFLIEGHHPMLAPDLVKFDLSRPDLLAKNEQGMEQRRASLAYLDRCLTLYSRVFEGKTQIFFSDHGNYWSNVEAWSEERLHVYCLVLGKDIPKTRVREFFSYVNFEELLRWLIEPEKNTLDSALQRKIISQDVDYYGESTVNAAINFFQKGYPHSGIAYRCVRTGNCKYVINALGEEFYYTIDEDGAETLAPLKDDALRAELQSKCGTSFIDIRKFEKFRHSRKLYESILRNHPELGKPLWEREDP